MYIYFHIYFEGLRDIIIRHCHACPAFSPSHGGEYNIIQLEINLQFVTQSLPDIREFFSRICLRESILQGCPTFLTNTLCIRCEEFLTRKWKEDRWFRTRGRGNGTVSRFNELFDRSITKTKHGERERERERRCNARKENVRRHDSPEQERLCLHS